MGRERVSSLSPSSPLLSPALEEPVLGQADEPLGRAAASLDGRGQEGPQLLRQRLTQGVPARLHHVGVPDLQQQHHRHRGAQQHLHTQSHSHTAQGGSVLAIGIAGEAGSYQRVSEERKSLDARGRHHEAERQAVAQGQQRHEDALHQVLVPALARKHHRGAVAAEPCSNSNSNET